MPAHTYHEVIEAFVDFFVQTLDKICIRDAVNCPAEGILLREVGKFMRDVHKRTDMTGTRQQPIGERG